MFYKNENRILSLWKVLGIGMLLMRSSHWEPSHHVLFVDALCFLEWPEELGLLGHLDDNRSNRTSALSIINFFSLKIITIILISCRHCANLVPKLEGWRRVVEEKETAAHLRIWLRDDDGGKWQINTGLLFQHIPCPSPFDQLSLTEALYAIHQLRWRLFDLFTQPTKAYNLWVTFLGPRNCIVWF